jgi:hypothetical protein
MLFQRPMFLTQFCVKYLLQVQNQLNNKLLNYENYLNKKKDKQKHSEKSSFINMLLSDMSLWINFAECNDCNPVTISIIK